MDRNIPANVRSASLNCTSLKNLWRQFKGYFCSLQAYTNTTISDLVKYTSLKVYFCAVWQDIQLKKAMKNKNNQPKPNKKWAGDYSIMSEYYFFNSFSRQVLLYFSPPSFVLRRYKQFPVQHWVPLIARKPTVSSKPNNRNQTIILRALYFLWFLYVPLEAADFLSTGGRLQVP